MKQKYILLATCIVAVFLVSCAPMQQAAGAPPRTITVVGEGKVRTSPDIAQVNVGVEVAASTVPEAAKQTAKTMEALMAALKAQGVAEIDIQTSSYNVYAERPYIDPMASAGSETPPTTYRFSNNVMVTVRDITKIEDILAAAIEAGANNIYMGTFDVADPSKLRAQAREEAVKIGKAKAEELAKLNGVTLGKIVNINENVDTGMPFMNSAAFSSAEGKGGGGGPISPGELELNVQLQLTYEIQ